VAVQSLYFEFGSEQTLHRDPVVVPTRSHGHLLAAWIALEDIGAESGALVYVPGSHRLPYFEFAPGQYQFDGRTMGHRVAEALAFDEEQCARHGLHPRLFTAQKGQVLFWHAGLRHGGGPVTGPGATRRSLVVHYTSRRTYGARSITVCERVRGAGGAIEERCRVMETTALLGEGAARGFDNPMRGCQRPG
jgi:ectoine hydroxylase-related dioxygenase (phytanoyl-CoA dioxygenase family)